MDDYNIWYNDKKINAIFNDKLNGFIKKIKNIKNYLFILTTNKKIYYSIINELEDFIKFNIIDFIAIDIDCNSEYLFIVNDNDGSVVKLKPYNFEIIETIVLKENAKLCSHGCQQNEKLIKVKSIACNDLSILFITENDELWANGNIPQIDIKCDIPKKVIFFDGRIISSISCGINFWIAICRKITNSLNDDTDDENDIEKIYVNTCLKCINEINDDNKTNNKLTLNSTTEKRNNIVIDNELNNNSINTNFIKKQLSRVSSLGDDIVDNNNYDDSSNSSKILRQNVSNVANFVCEGVKLISDKVTNLSRQMSNNDNDKIHLTDMNIKLPLYQESSRQNSLKNDDDVPSSIGSSFDYHDLIITQNCLDEKINNFIDTGNNLLSTELWSWGDTNYGQLGIGDNISRTKPVLITKLQNTGIQKISCGSYHTLALTLDGRVFSWGKNNYKQIINDTSLHQSSPKQINPTKKNNSDVRATDISAGEKYSLIIINQEIYLIGKINDNDDDCIKKLDTIDELSTMKINYLSSSGKYTIYSLNNKPNIIINKININNEKLLLEEMIIVSQNLIKKLQKKTTATKELNAYEKLCNSYLELMSLTALNVKSINNYMNNKLKINELLLILNVDEFTNIYRYYINALCDVISLGGIKKMAKIMPEQSDNIRKLYYTIDNWKNITIEDIITNALQSPINKLNNYLLLLSDIINNNNNNNNNNNLCIDIIKKTKLKWENLYNDQKKYINEAIKTRNFWDNFGKSIDIEKTPERRLIRESHTHQLFIMNTSFTSFTSYWFILLNDIFIHTTGTSNYTVYPLSTVWIESIGDSETSKNTISMITPEKNFLFYTTTSIEKNEWLNAFQNAIKKNIHNNISKNPPRSRTASYKFLKHSLYKDALYNGRWLNGKPHGFGEMKWNDGKIYIGDFYNGLIHGNGKITIPLKGSYDGEWIDGKQYGFGHYQYENGDIYDGWFKDDLPHGHGVKQEGHLMTEIASIYIGDWSAGLKHGYGVKDDQISGEKYLGSWFNDHKHGTGIIVTLDGIYYEGEFINDIMMGHGLMVFDNGTHYEGEIKSAGCFGGKGILELQNGYTIDGIIHGNWNDNIKVIATLQLNKNNNNNNNNFTKPPSFSKIGVAANQKWKSIFHQCYELLGLIDPANRSTILFNKTPETQRIWDNLAVVINKSLQKSTIDTNYNLSSSSSLKYRDKDLSISDELSKIPKFGRDDLTIESYELIKNYLNGAFESIHHPLGWLLNEMSSVFNSSYGGVRVHPLLLIHAVAEIKSITERIYELVNLLFPALPKYGLDMVLKSNNDNYECDIISADGLLHPILLPQVNSSLFLLYALHNKNEDDAYWERLIKWNKQNDERLMELLDVDKKFWNKNFINKKNDNYFNDAIENLQQLKTTFSPLEKLMVIKKTFEKVTKEVQNDFGSVYMWSMDELFPVINFVVIRAGVLQLGSEINLIEDFMEPYVSNGELGIMFSTLKASYQQVLNEKIDMTD